MAALASSTCERDGALSPGDVFPSPCTPAPPHGMASLEHTPIRKNKRKLSEPRKRTDFSIKRLCPGSPGSVGESDSHSTSEEMDRLHEDPPDTPEGSVADDLSQGGSDRDGTPIPPHGAVMFPSGLRTNCIVPNLYYRNSEFSIRGSLVGVNSANVRENHFNSEVMRTDSRLMMDEYSSPPSPQESDADEEEEEDDGDGRRPRKNYKNMTRERRVEANARERSRVHTISAAFDSLRRAVPSYSYNQKLSKLAILRIACTYIMALARLADMDYSEEQSNMSFSDCVDMCTSTIQTEGRARRRH